MTNAVLLLLLDGDIWVLDPEIIEVQEEEEMEVDDVPFTLCLQACGGAAVPDKLSEGRWRSVHYFQYEFSDLPED